MKSTRYWVDKFELTEHESEELTLVEDIQADAQREPLEVLRDARWELRRLADLEPPPGAVGAGLFVNAELRRRINTLLAGELEVSPEDWAKAYPEPTTLEVAEAVREHLRSEVHRYYKRHPATASADYYQVGVGDALRLIISCDLAPILEKLGAERTEATE